MESSFLFEEGKTFERGRVREKDTWKREGECFFSEREEEDFGKKTKEEDFV
jgi:fructose-1,6-bisphosphatase